MPKTVILRKSYRSTFEITDFAQRILPNNDLEAIERHGDEVLVSSFKNEQEEIGHIKKQIIAFTKSDNNAMGIVCKTQQQADKLYQQLKAPNEKIYLLNDQSAAFANGVIITTTHMAKGLEFDQVLVPNCTEKNYQNDMDRHLLYIACTRAMHKLELTSWGKMSGLVC